MSCAVTTSSGGNQFMKDFREEGMVDDYLKYMHTCLYCRLIISMGK